MYTVSSLGVSSKPASPVPATIDDDYHMSRWLAEWGIDLDGPEVSDEELEARAADGDESDPETWGYEWDASLWVPTESPSADEPEPFDPADDDRAWWAGQSQAAELDDRDMAEFTMWAERVDILAGRVGIEPEHIARSVAGCCHESALV